MSSQSNFYILDKKSKSSDAEALRNIYDEIKDNFIIGDVLLNDKLPSDDESQKLLANIEKHLTNNNKKFSRFPNDYMHGLISYDVYREHAKENEVVNFEEEEWTILRAFHEPKEDGGETVKKGSFYTGVLYLNEKKRQLVLSQKSTFDFVELVRNAENKMNVKESVINQIIPQLAICYDITQKANIIAKENGYFLSFTGYSNGAWLAEHSINFSSHYFRNTNTRAVLFESPGITENHDSETKSTSVVSNDGDDAKSDFLDIVNYLSAPNISNSCNMHSGKIYRLFLEPENLIKSNALSEFVDKVKKVPKYGELFLSSRFILDGFFSMFHQSNLRKLLELFDKKTGAPVECEQVEHWPMIRLALDMAHQNLVKQLAGTTNDNLIEHFQPKDLLPKYSSTVLRAIVLSISELIEKETLPGIHILVDIISQLINSGESLESFENALFYNKLANAANSSGDDFRKKLKKFDVKNQFTLSYKATYKTKEVNLYRDELYLNYRTKNADWCLVTLKQHNLKENVPNKFIFNQLKQLQGEFTFENSDLTMAENKSNSKNNQPINKIIVSNKDGGEISNIKERLIRLLSLYPTIKEQIQENELANSALSKNSVANQLPDKIRNYVKRQYLFEKFNSIFNSDTKQNKSLIICGQSGTGKSTLAAEYAHQTKNYTIRWFNVDSTKNFESNYVENLFQQLELNSDDMKKKPLPVRLNVLSHKLETTNLNILFIFDNVVSETSNLMQLIVKELPENVKIIATTNLNSKDLLQSFDCQIEMEPFSQKEAEFYITSSLKRKMIKSDFDHFLSSFPYNFNPLKINNALAVLKRNENRSASIKSIVDKMKPNNYEKVFEYLLQDVFGDTSDVNSILLNIAFMECDNLNEELIIRITKFTKHTVFEPLNQLIDLYILNSKVYKDNDTLYSVHRDTLKELKQYISKYIPQRELNELFSKNIKVFLSLLEELKDKILKNDSDFRANIFNLKYDIAHIESFINNFLNDEVVKTKEDMVTEAWCNILISFVYKEVFYKYDVSLDHGFKALDKLCKVYPQKDHADVAEAYNSIGSSYLNLDEFEKSVDYENMALDIYSKVFENQEQIRVADSMNILGISYRNLGDNSKAIDYLNKSLDIYNKCLENTEHPNIINSLNNLGIIYSNLGNYEKATEFFKTALEKKTKSNADHKSDSSVADILNNIGKNYAYLKQYFISIDYQTEALEIYKKIYKDEDNFKIADQLNTLGSTYMSFGKNKEALEYLNKALDLYVKIYGNKENASTADILTNIGLCYRDMSDYNKSIEYLNKSMSMKKVIYSSEDDLNIGDCLCNIGKTYMFWKKYDKSIQFLLKSHEIYAKYYKEDDETIGNVLNNIGLCYTELEQYKKSIEYLKKALDIYYKVYPDKDHPSILRTMEFIDVNNQYLKL